MRLVSAEAGERTRCGAPKEAPAAFGKRRGDDREPLRSLKR